MYEYTYKSTISVNTFDFSVWSVELFEDSVIHCVQFTCKRIVNFKQLPTTTRVSLYMPQRTKNIYIGIKSIAMIRMGGKQSFEKGYV